jgi:hypothetical protein
MFYLVILQQEQGDCNIRITSNSRYANNSKDANNSKKLTRAETPGTLGTPIAEQTLTTAWKAATVETLAIEGTPGKKQQQETPTAGTSEPVKTP